MTAMRCVSLCALALAALCPIPLPAQPPAAAAPSLELFVSPQGNDAWSGKLAAPNAEKTDGPLATLERARDAIRALAQAKSLPAGGVVVRVRGGVYCLSKPLKLDKSDSGTAAAPIVYQAHEGEKPTITGCRPVTQFAPHQGAIVKANLAACGLKGATFRQIFFDGRRQILARYPNFDADNPYGGGWAYADGQPLPMYADRPDDDPASLTYKAQDARRWANPQEGEVFVFARYNWWNNILPIAAVDPQNRVISLKKKASYDIRPGDRYYVQGLLEELDAPGEWYLDRAVSTLYFWPPSPLDGKAVYVPVTRTLMELSDTQWVTFRGFTIEGCEGTAVTLKNASHCLIAGNTIRNVGDYNGSGVAISGGTHNGAVGNDIYAVGSSGVAISGGDRLTLTPAENYADNNYIHHVGVYYKQGTGISMTGVGNRASHNLIHDGPRMGIIFGGSNNLVIEYNHIRHVNLETEDTGAVYTGGRDWISSRGTVIRYNYFHDLLGFGRHDGKWTSPYFAWGVYLDDNAGGVDVIGNIVVRATRAGLHLHNGRDNHIENNIFVENGPQQIEYSGWTATHRHWVNHFDLMKKGYESVADQPAWRGMRNMDLHPSQALRPDGTIMSGNQFQRNIVAYGDPKAKLYALRNASSEYNKFDYNLIHHPGGPVATGYLRLKETVGKNLLANGRFEDGKRGEMPAGWRWQMHPKGSTAIGVEVDGARGKRALRMSTAAASEAGKQDPVIVSTAVPARPGQGFRLSARMKAACDEVKVSLAAQSYVAKAYFWSKPTECKVGTQWKEYELVFALPAPGEKGYHDQMASVAARFDVRDENATVWVDDVVLKEAVLLDQWESWQATGQDAHSVLADPLFVDPAHDDYRLRPDSPAFKLGFKPIPVEKIGPYQDPLRASWPIVEAEGAREKPIRTGQ